MESEHKQGAKEADKEPSKKADEMPMSGGEMGDMKKSSENNPRRIKSATLIGSRRNGKIRR